MFRCCSSAVRPHRLRITPLPHVRAGRLRALAVGGDKRVPQLPEVPTAAEAGVTGYYSTS